MEIAEEEEEEHRETKRQSVVEEEDEETKPGEIDHDQSRPRSPITGPPVTLDSNLASSPQESQFAGGTVEPPSFIGVPRPASPAKSFDDARRMSSQSSRQDYYSHSSYLHSKPRVKLGPRPSVDPTGRPRSSAGNTVRPVASMPAGLKLSVKGAKKSKHDDSSSVISEEHSDDTFLTSSLSIPEDTSRPHTSGGRPTTSSGASVKSLPAVTTPAKNILTPEKLRLMKAMQLREKKKRASEMQTATPPVPSVQITTSPAVQVDDKETEIETQPSATVETETQETAMLQPADTESDPAADQVSKADSGIDVASSIPTDHGSVRTQTDSRPTSPIGASSEVDDSTQASSVSESTDETVQPSQENKEATEETETPASADQLIVGASSTGAEVKDTPSAQGQDAPEAPEAGLTQQVGSLSEPNLAQADETRDDQSAEHDEKLTPADEKVTPSESSLIIPTSKFAAKVASGQAASDPMASRDADPPNVTSVPERIDEVDPAPVGPSERTEDGPAASPTKWNVPISKYSTHDSSKCLAPSPILENVESFTTSPNGQDNLADAATKMDDEIASGETGRSDTKRRPEPILTGSNLPDKETTTTREDDKKSTDDGQSTIVDEAKSITVTSPTSPVTTIPASQSNEQSTPRILRTVSSPAGSPRTSVGDPPPSATRSVSGSVFQNRTSQPPGSAHLAPRSSAKVGSGISSRIKAFEQIAAKSGPVAPVVPVSKDRPSSAFFSVRQNSIRDGARSPSVLERTNSIYRGRTPTPNESLDGSPETVRSRQRSDSVASRMSVFENGNAPRGRPETVSVTARIVRDPGQSYPRPPSQLDFSDYSMELKQSPLVVDHQKNLEEREGAPAPAADAPPVPTPLIHAGEPRRSLQERRLSKDTKGSSIDDSLHRPGQRTSLTMARDFFRESMVGKDVGSAGRPPSVHVHQPSTSSLMSRLSISTRRKSITQDQPLQSPTSAGEKSESGDEKKEGNRATRIMRRLSSTFSPKKSGPAATSPVLPEETNENENAIPPRSMTAPAAPAAGMTAASMGDVNVQFPENLLWKRRSMSLDSNGFLHLTPAQGAVSARERQSKRFHMSEFKSPYAPEIEVQELPNSVCLDFLSGSGLQFAFQDRAGQLHGLQGKSHSL